MEDIREKIMELIKGIDDRDKLMMIYQLIRGIKSSK